MSNMILLMLLLGLVIIGFCLRCRVECRHDGYSGTTLGKAVDSHFPDQGCYEGKDCPSGYVQFFVASGPPPFHQKEKSECCPLSRNVWVPPCITPGPKKCPKGHKKIIIPGTFGKKWGCCPKFTDCEPSQDYKCPSGKQLVGRTYSHGMLPCCNVSRY